MRQSRTQPTNKQPSGHTATHVVKHHTRNKAHNTHTPPATRHAQSQARTDKHTRSPSEQHRARIQGNPRSRTNQAQPQGHPDTAYATNATTPGNHTPGGACPLAARNALTTAQPQAKGKHPNTPHQGRAHPNDAESRPNVAETRKREKHTPRPPEQRRGSPNRQEHEPQRTAEESNLTHNHVSEPISSRTQQPCWITVQKRGNKHGEQEQRAKTRNKNPRTNRHKKTHPAAAPTTGLHAPMSATTRAHTHPYSTVSLPQYQSRDSNSHAQPGTRF